MAQLTRLRCPACGTPRNPAVFGIDGSDMSFVEDAGHEAQVSIQTIGGRGRCSWAHFDAPLEVSVALCKSLRAALARLEAEVREAGGRLDD
jgi:hypothetical protein